MPESHASWRRSSSSSGEANALSSSSNTSASPSTSSSSPSSRAAVSGPEPEEVGKGGRALEAAEVVVGQQPKMVVGRHLAASAAGDRHDDGSQTAPLHEGSMSSATAS